MTCHCCFILTNDPPVEWIHYNFLIFEGYVMLILLRANLCLLLRENEPHPGLHEPDADLDEPKPRLDEQDLAHAAGSPAGRTEPALGLR